MNRTNPSAYVAAIRHSVEEFINCEQNSVEDLRRVANFFDHLSGRFERDATSLCEELDNVFATAILDVPPIQGDDPCELSMLHVITRAAEIEPRYALDAVRVLLRWNDGESDEGTQALRRQLITAAAHCSDRANLRKALKKIKPEEEK